MSGSVLREEKSCLGFNDTASIRARWGCDPSAPATGAGCISRAALQSNFSLFMCVLDQAAQHRCRIPACCSHQHPMELGMLSGAPTAPQAQHREALEQLMGWVFPVML